MMGGVETKCLRCGAITETRSPIPVTNEILERLQRRILDLEDEVFQAHADTLAARQDVEEFQYRWRIETARHALREKRDE